MIFRFTRLRRNLIRSSNQPACYSRQNTVYQILAAALVLFAIPACQQKMAKQPYYRPYAESEFFNDHLSVRPYEEGTIHRTQYLLDNPLATGVTPEVRLEQAKMEGKFNVPLDKINQALPGAPNNPANFVTAFPFEITPADLKRGQERYQIYCIECHGPLGNGKGKIAERGYLKPTSYHTIAMEPNEVPESGDLPKGYSRGFFRWNIKIPLREVPVGYIFEVITKGYGGMPDHAAQIPAIDRWRIIAYVRTLQLSRFAEENKKIGSNNLPTKPEQPGNPKSKDQLGKNIEQEDTKGQPVVRGGK